MYVIRTTYLPQIYTANKKLCIVECVNSYLGVNKKLADANVMEFIITHGKPHKSALSDTISRWIKQDELGKAGINTNIYTAQNCKAASTSKTRGNGISITEILKEGCWKSEIRTFYSKISYTIIVGKTLISYNSYFPRVKQIYDRQ